MKKMKIVLLIAILLTLNNKLTENIEKVYSQIFSEEEPVGQEVKGEYSRVFITVNEKKTFLDEDNFNDIQPDRESDYVVWSREVNGEGQIFRYHIPTESIIQLTHTSTNLNPKVDAAGRVVWERWVKDGWQVYLFDGLKIRQISDGKTAMSPDVEGNIVVFAKRLVDATGTWTAQSLDLANNLKSDLATGEVYKFPKIVKGKIEFDFKKKNNGFNFSESVYAEEEPQQKPENNTVEDSEEEEEDEVEQSTASAENKTTIVDQPTTVTVEEVKKEIENLISPVQNDTPESSSSNLLTE